MNAIITQYKKAIVLAIVVVAVSISSAAFAKCGPCAAAAAIRQSIKDAHAALLAAGKPVSREMEMELDLISEDASRAPREELADPCNICPDSGNEIDVANLNCKLQTLYDCCVNTNQQVRCQTYLAEKSYKKIRHDIDDVEDCCASVKRRIGDLDSAGIDIPNPCLLGFNIVDFVNNTDIDAIAWLKSLYILLFQVYECSCQPCFQPE